MPRASKESAPSRGKGAAKGPAKPAEKSPTKSGAPQFDLGLLASIPDQDLEDIVASIKRGAKHPGDALGFGPEALNAVEQMAVGFYRANMFDRAAVLYGFLLRMNP